MNLLTLDDLGRLFGLDARTICSPSTDLFLKGGWRFEFIEGESLDTLVSELLDRIRRKDFSIVVPDDKTRWLCGWEKISNSS